MDKIVKLNVGGVLYSTTTSTLLSHTDSYFGALLSEKFAALKDENGAYFIDRNGQYFGYILEYLRTGEIELPSNISPTIILKESMFFSLSQLSEVLQQCIENSKKKEEKYHGIRLDGYYICGVATQKIVISFRKRNRLFYAYGRGAEENIITFLHTRKTPQIWENDGRMPAQDFVKFCTKHIHRGIYFVESNYIRIRTEERGERFFWPGIKIMDEIYMPQITTQFIREGESWVDTGMLKYSFVSLNTMDDDGLLFSESRFSEQLDFEYPNLYPIHSSDHSNNNNHN